MSDVTPSGNVFLRQLFQYLGQPLNASAFFLTADIALPANTWVKVNTLNVAQPPTHDAIAIVDPGPNPFIDNTTPGGPNLSSAGYQVMAFGQVVVSAATAGVFYVTFDITGLGDMTATAIAAGAVVTGPIMMNGTTMPTGSAPSLWVRSTVAATLKKDSPIVDHTGALTFGTRITVLTFPISH